MPEFSCYAINGLIVTSPVAELTKWLNDNNTPDGIHFNEVGGLDPQIGYSSILTDVANDVHAGKQVIVVGHSYGGMACYYLADDLNTAGLKAPLFIPIDPTCWASNLPGTMRWGWSLADGGRWSAPPNVARWINYHQPYYPGGGICINPGGGVTDTQVAGVDHLSIVNSPIVRSGVLNAVRGLL
jgi:hypothetical protein